MNLPLIDQITRAVLYEGYILYPYRPSVKTQQRWTFGGIYPKSYSDAQQGTDAWSMQAQILIQGNDQNVIGLTARFLHLTARAVEAADNQTGEPKYHVVDSLHVGNRTFQTWQEAVERKIEAGDIRLSELLAHPRRHRFVFPHSRTIEPLHDDNGQFAGRLVRDQQQIEGVVEFSAKRKADGVYQITARVLNETRLSDAGTATRDTAVMKSFASTHMILTAAAGGFVSPTDPRESLCDLVGDCSNVGCWPVLVGDAGSTDTLLISPIILSDYPEIAPESPGDLFDGCEIDEILTLRIMTLTDEEKRQAIAVDPLAADMMARTEALARDQLMNLHGAVRQLRPVMQESHHD